MNNEIENLEKQVKWLAEQVNRLDYEIKHLKGRHVKYLDCRVERSDGVIFDTVRQAGWNIYESGLAKNYKGAANGIVQCAKGNAPQAYGYRWRFLDEG